MNFFKTVSTDK